ncbi:MAG: dienelactone hydrolase family protein [Drouetiella hepatica Uher 2000/2452]|jgi:carboxymethylenebutenolidase|uniref:Dienelactone hydrolase family protein n=1 Tax=Drouetiella hepatica Uher 2000/2452 TaxID=904376 RepID=A0A951Q712_9CYAN|nr:dienelactone hydrolase family protein [Drouetiella hepatica Uher 2000/2452]
MTETTIRITQAQVPNGDLQISAYLAEPIATSTFPAIIVLQEIFGVNAHIRDVVERFAKAGYVAIAPALYQRLAPGYESGYDPEAIKQGRIYKDQTRADELISDIQSTVDYLYTLPSVTGAIGCIGFCFGGHVAYLAATLPGIKATASFYGAGIPTFTPGGGEPTIAHTPEIQSILYAFFGLDDASIPPDHVEQIEAALQQHQIPHKIFRYAGAEHGFFCDRRPAYNPTAAADAWTQVLALFSQL